jgi:hypothetical protein
MSAPARQVEHTETGAASCAPPSPSRATWPTTRRSGSPPSGTQITEITVLVNERRLSGKWVAAPTRHVVRTFNTRATTSPNHSRTATGSSSTAPSPPESTPATRHVQRHRAGRLTTTGKAPHSMQLEAPSCGGGSCLVDDHVPWHPVAVHRDAATVPVQPAPARDRASRPSAQARKVRPPSRSSSAVQPPGHQT